MGQIKIPKEKLKGDDKYKTFSVRIPNSLYNKLTALAEESELSRNEIIIILLREALNIATVSK